MLTVMATLALGLGLCGLSGCAEPNPTIPTPIDQDQEADVRQVIDVYVRLVQQNGKTVGITEGVQDAMGPVRIKQTRPMTRSEAVKLIEQDLREQAGIVVVHRDRKHIIFGLSGNPDQHPVRWLSPH